MDSSLELFDDFPAHLQKRGPINGEKGSRYEPYIAKIRRIPLGKATPIPVPNRLAARTIAATIQSQKNAEYVGLKPMERYATRQEPKNGRRDGAWILWVKREIRQL